MDTDIHYYTDGQNVSVTASGFKVKRQLYQLTGITRHGVSIISPTRIPFALLIIIGSMLFASGALNLLPAAWKTNVTIFGFSLLVNSVFMTGGVIVLMIGLMLMLKVKEKYAVRIATADGEKDVVVSQSREYIKQIVEALNHAFLDAGEKNKKR